jgi:D-amino peptidase
VKVHISIDMEGIAGIADAADTTPGAPHFSYARELMTGECNAAIAGCFDGGATEVIVNDSHDGMLNLIPDRLDRRARIIRGRSKAYGMMQGIDDDTAATMFIGYHARAGNENGGVLNHTMRGRDVLGVFLNDEPAGELRLNAALAGCHNIPVVLISGDDVLCEEGQSCLGRVEAVAVKEAIDKYTALSLHPELAQEQIRDGAMRGISKLAEYQPFRIETPATLRVSWNSTSIAALCECVPGVKRVGARDNEYISADYPEIYRLLRILLALAGTTATSGYTYD